MPSRGASGTGNAWAEWPSRAKQTVMGTNGFRLYLRLGDIVTHRDYPQWGEGTVEEEMTSTVPGGTCLVRIKFQDGRQRTFNNDLDAETCCYYFGIRKYWLDNLLDGPTRVRRTRRQPARLVKREA